MEGKNFLQRYLENQKKYDEHFKNVAEAKYKCMVCGRDDVTHKQMLENSYVKHVNGSQSRTSGLSKQLVVCGEECRKKRVPFVDYGYLMLGTGMQKRYFNARLDMFTNVVEPFNKVNEWLTNPETGLLIVGPVGTGKTTMAASIVYELRKQEKSVYFISYSQMAMDANGIYLIDDALEFVSKYSKYEFLVIDDIAQDYLTEKAKQTLSNLFRVFYDNQKKIILTTNFELDELAGYIDPRLKSRLLEMCDPIILTGEDLRLKK